MVDFSDVSARLKKKREEQSPAPQERNFEEIHALRARILGVLLQDARKACGRTQAEVAAALRVSEDQVQRWEFGYESPSLPQLEMLAYYLDVPVSRFWDSKTVAQEQAERDVPVPTEDYSALRDRVIGIRLAMARKEARLSQEEAAKASGLTLEQIQDFEQGRAPIPFPALSTLAFAVRRSISYFLEDTGRVGAWLRLQEEYRRFSELPDEIRAFVTQPVNQPFIEIAMRLSHLPLQELRTVGEKILDITL